MCFTCTNRANADSRSPMACQTRDAAIGKLVLVLNLGLAWCLRCLRTFCAMHCSTASWLLMVPLWIVGFVCMYVTCLVQNREVSSAQEKTHGTIIASMMKMPWCGWSVPSLHVFGFNSRWYQFSHSVFLSWNVWVWVKIDISLSCFC